MIQYLKNWAAKLKQQMVVLHLAIKNPRTPWYARVLVLLIMAYALSPIDLIPDFIPILGLLDDLILLPIGIYCALKLIPFKAIEDAKIQAKNFKWNKKRSLAGAFAIGFIWLLLALLIFFYLFN